MSKRVKSATDSASDALAAALTPLARTLIQAGIGAGDLIQAAKIAYVHAALRELFPTGRKPNISRLAVATGLTRKEIAALLRPKDDKRTPPSTRRNLQQRALRVLQGWHVDPIFHRADGRPADLPLYGEQPSFALLVKRHAGDVTPIAVLRELERMQAVTVTPSGKIKFHRRTIASTAHAVQQMAQFASLFKDFTNTVQQVSEPQDPPLFFGFKDARVDSSQQAALFQRTFSRRAATLLESTEQWIGHQIQKGNAKAGDSRARARVGLGVYLVHDEE